MELCVNWSKAIPQFINDFNLFKSPPNYYITFPEVSAGASFSGGGYLFIGAVILNWMEGNLIQRHFSIKDGLTRSGNDDEIIMDVPGWLEFMKEYYSDCLE